MQLQTDTPFISHRTIQLMRWSGYGLLLLSSIDLITLLVPPALTNPVWEFQTVGAIVDRIPVPLLALAIIFFGENQLRNRWERKLVTGLSWACLGLGIFLLLLIPLGVTSATRLQQQVSDQINFNYRQQVNQVQQLETRLNQSSNQDFTALLKKNSIAYDPAQEPRESFLQQLTQYRQQVKTQFELDRQVQTTTLLKNATKWTIGAALSSFLLIYFWRLTRWARVK